MKKDKALLATIIFALFFYGGIYLGNIYQEKVYNNVEKEPVKISVPKVIASAIFNCDNGKSINSRFTEGAVYLTLSDGRKIHLPQAISASGARYANADESFVFWNKGDTAFIQEGENYTYENCLTQGAE